MHIYTNFIPCISKLVISNNHICDVIENQRIYVLLCVITFEHAWFHIINDFDNINRKINFPKRQKSFGVDYQRQEVQWENRFFIYLYFLIVWSLERKVCWNVIWNEGGRRKVDKWPLLPESYVAITLRWGRACQRMTSGFPCLTNAETFFVFLITQLKNFRFCSFLFRDINSISSQANKKLYIK